LVIATNQAFKNTRKKDDTPQVEDDTNVTHKEDTKQDTDQVPTKYRPSTDQVDPIVIEKIVEVPVEVIKEVEKIVEVPVEVIREVEKIVEVPVYKEKEKLPDEELFETEEIFDLQNTIDNVEKDQIKTENEKIPVVQQEPKRLSYSNRNGGSFKIDRF
jgi:hypothetical protein